MARAAHKDFREVGLEIGLIIGRYLLKMDDLHYGFWKEGIERTFWNLPAAQQAFSEFLVESIPPGAKAILDVGCGAANLAARLLARGSSVDVVSPGEYLTERVRAKLGGKGRIYASTFEDMPVEATYDVVLFSESFQYVNMEIALEKIPRLLNPGGHLLICDFFKTGAPGKSPLGGGGRLHQLQDAIKAGPFDLVKDQDVTRETAPTIDILGDAFMNVGRPIRDVLLDFFSKAYPRLSKLVLWKFRKRLAKLDYKTFSGRLTGAEFAIHKTYRLFLLRKKS